MFAERRFLLGVAGAALIVAGLRYAWAYLSPFLVAVLLAAVIEPAVNALHQRWRVGRGTAALLVLAVALVLLAAAAAVVLVNVTSELERLLEALPGAAARLDGAVSRLSSAVERYARGLPRPLDNVAEATIGQASQAAAAAVGAALASLKAAPNVAFLAVVAAVATYFISRDRHRLWAAVLKALPVPWRAPVVRLRDEVFGGVLGMMRAQLTMAGLTGALAIAGLMLVGVPYSWLLGIVAALLDLIPMIGPAIVLAPVALAYAVHGDTWRAMALAGLMLFLFVARQWLEPHLMGAQLGIHPLPMLMAVYAAVQATGAAGFLLGPLALIVVKAFLGAAGGPPGRR